MSPDSRTLYVAGENALHETMLSGDQHPVTLAPPHQDDRVVRASQADLTDMHDLMSRRLQMPGNPAGDVLIEQEPHADRDTGRWYSRTENDAYAMACWMSAASMNGKSP
jgi:hypothetical protein